VQQIVCPHTVADTSSAPAKRHLRLPVMGLEGTWQQTQVLAGQELSILTIAGGGCPCRRLIQTIIAK